MIDPVLPSVRANALRYRVTANPPDVRENAMGRASHRPPPHHSTPPWPGRHSSPHTPYAGRPPGLGKLSPLTKGPVSPHTECAGYYGAPARYRTVSDQALSRPLSYL